MVTFWASIQFLKNEKATSNYISTTCGFPILMVEMPGQVQANYNVLFFNVLQIAILIPTKIPQIEPQDKYCAQSKNDQFNLSLNYACLSIQ